MSLPLDVDILLALEGGSDVDRHITSGWIEYIQVKARPLSASPWTVTDIFREVFHKYPDMGKEKRRFTLVLDTHLTPEAITFYSICQWLSAKPDDVVWDAYLRNSQALEADQECRFPASTLWNVERRTRELLRCSGRDLPDRIKTFRSLFSLPNNATDDVKSLPDLSIDQICDFLASLTIVTHADLPTMKHQVRESITQYVPQGLTVDDVQGLLHSFALELATVRAGETISRDDLLRSVGITHKPFIPSEIIAACQRNLRPQLDMLNEGDVPYAAPRREADSVFNHFLQAPGSRIFALSGPSRFGKTRQLREWATRLCPVVPVVFVEAAIFDPERIADDISRALGHEGRHLAMSLLDIIRRASAGQETQDRGYGFLLFLDAPDETTDVHSFERHLRTLLDQIASLRIKIVIGCKSSAWTEVAPLLERVRKWCWQSPFGATEGQTQEPPFVPSFELAPLTNDERDHALRANALMVPANSETLHETLLLPGCLGIFYRLLHSGSDIHAEYPVQLYQHFWDELMEKWRRATRKREQALTDTLLTIAQAIRRNVKADSAIPLSELETIATRIPLDIDSDEKESPYYEARTLGILRDMDGRVSFGLPFLLELALATTLRTELDNIPKIGSENVQEWVSSVSSEISEHRSEALAVAFALCIQRLCLEKDDRVQILLRQVLRHIGILDPIPFVRVVTDAAATELAMFVRRKDDNWFEAKNALAALRTPKSIRELFALTNHSDKDVLEHIFYGLKHHPLPEAWVLEFLVQLPEYAASSSRRALGEAIDALGYAALDLGDQRPLRILEDFLLDERHHVRIRAALALSSIGHRSSEVPLISALPKALTDDPEMFQAISEGLVHLGAPSVAEPLIHLLNSTPPTEDDPTYKLRSSAVWSLGELALLETAPIFEQILRRGRDEPNLAVEWAFRGLRRTGAADVALPYLRSASLGESQIPFTFFHTPISEIAALGTTAAQRLLLEILSHDARDPNVQKLWIVNIGNALQTLDTLELVEGFTTLRKQDPNGFTEVEDVAFRLMTENYSRLTTARTVERECHQLGKWLLIGIGSDRFGEASALFLSSRANEDLFSMRELVEDIAVVGDANFLDILRMFSDEVAPRIGSATDTAPEEQRHNTIYLQHLLDEVAQAIPLFNGSEAFAFYLDIISRHEVLRDGLRAVEWFARGEPDLQAVFALAENPHATEAARYQATYVAGSRTELTEVECERLLQLFLNLSNPASVRRWAVKALGWHGYRKAVPALHQMLVSPASAEQHSLRGEVEETLCRMGDRDAAQRLLTEIRRERTSWSSSEDRLLGRVACFPKGEAGREEIDRLLVDFIKNDHFGFCGAAMLAVDNQFDHGYLVPGTVEALKGWLLGSRESWLTGIDDQIGPALLARIDAVALCEVTNKISFDNWSENARKYLIDALGETGCSEAVISLLGFVKREKLWLRRAATLALSKIAVRDREVEQKLATVFTEMAESLVVLEVIITTEALLWLQFEWADSLLEALTVHDDRRVRRTAQAVRTRRSEQSEAKKVVSRFLHEPSKSNRWMLAQSLQQIGDENTMESLLILLKDPDKRLDTQHAILAERIYEEIKKRLDGMKTKMNKKSLYEINGF